MKGFATCIHGVWVNDHCDECESRRNDNEAPVPAQTNVVRWQGVTTHVLPVERILEGAQNANLKSMTIIGYDENGEFYFASTDADGPSVMWDLEAAKKKLLEAGGL